MRRRIWFSTAIRSLVLASILLIPSAAQAGRTEDEPPEIVDARLEGYAGQMALPESSSGLTWFLFVILGVVTAAGLFKDAKRSHLD